MDIWAVDRATIWSAIRARNELRRSALLPLVDEQKEFDAACWLIREKRWQAFKECHEADRQRFRDEVYAEMGRPINWISGLARGIEITKRFEKFLRANYADEIAMMREIEPDYLGITRHLTEARQDEPSD
jgi:hypothetical protein